MPSRPSSSAQAGNAGSTVTTTETHPILHLRPSAESESESERPKKKAHVKWNEDVVDNEHMGKKKSKICCIFHPQREFGESSDESSDSSSDGSSDESGNEAPDSNHHEDCCDHLHSHRRKGKKGRAKRESSPNAYERQPTVKKGPKEENKKEEGFQDTEKGTK